MEIQAKKEISFRNPEETVQANTTFQYAMRYFGISEVQGKTFEIVGFEKDQLAEMFENMFGALVPKRIQFDIGGSTVNVRAEYHPFLEANDGFALEIVLDSWYALMDPPRAFMNPMGEILFYDSSEIERMKKLLKKEVAVYGSPETQKLQEAGRDLSLEATAGWLLKFIINFLVDIPGGTDGPNEGTSREEIRDFLESRNS